MQLLIQQPGCNIYNIHQKSIDNCWLSIFLYTHRHRCSPHLFRLSSVVLPPHPRGHRPRQHAVAQELHAVLENRMELLATVPDGVYFFFWKDGKSFAADFIRRYKEKKEQIQLPIYTQRPLLIKIETSKTAKKTTARKKTGKKTETRDTPKTRTLAQPEKRSTASSPYYELEPSPKKTDLYHLCTNLRLVLGSNFFVGKFAYSSLSRYSTKNRLWSRRSAVFDFCQLFSYIFASNYEAI